MVLDINSNLNAWYNSLSKNPNNRGTFMKSKRTLFDIFLDIIIILLTLLIIYWFFELLLGGSPALNEFNFGLIILIITFLMKMHREMGETKVEIKHISRGVKHGFERIKEDMAQTREDINQINNNIKLIKNKLK